MQVSVISVFNILGINGFSGKEHLPFLCMDTRFEDGESSPLCGRFKLQDKHS